MPSLRISTPVNRSREKGREGEGTQAGIASSQAAAAGSAAAGAASAEASAGAAALEL